MLQRHSEFVRTNSNEAKNQPKKKKLNKVNSGGIWVAIKLSHSVALLTHKNGDHSPKT